MLQPCLRGRMCGPGNGREEPDSRGKRLSSCLHMLGLRCFWIVISHSWQLLCASPTLDNPKLLLVLQYCDEGHLHLLLPPTSLSSMFPQVKCDFSLYYHSIIISSENSFRFPLSFGARALGYLSFIPLSQLSFWISLKRMKHILVKTARKTLAKSIAIREKTVIKGRGWTQPWM